MIDNRIRILLILVLNISRALGETKTNMKDSSKPINAEQVHKADDTPYKTRGFQKRELPYILDLSSCGLFEKDPNPEVEYILKLFGEGLKSAGTKLGLKNEGLPEILLKTITNSLTNFPINPKNKGPENIFSGFFRLLGFDTEKLQAIALNAIVFIAQMIGSNLTRKSLSGGKEKPTEFKFDYDYDDYDEGDAEENDGKVKTGTPVDWFVTNARDEEVKRIMAETQKHDLSYRLANILITESPGQPPNDCLLHLLCRLEPVIKGMQDSTAQLFDNNHQPMNPKITLEVWSKMTPSERMYAYMPKNEDFKQKKRQCEQRLPPCYN